MFLALFLSAINNIQHKFVRLVTNLSHGVESGKGIKLERSFKGSGERVYCVNKVTFFLILQHFFYKSVSEVCRLCSNWSFGVDRSFREK